MRKVQTDRQRIRIKKWSLFNYRLCFSFSSHIPNPSKQCSSFWINQNISACLFFAKQWIFFLLNRPFFALSFGYIIICWFFFCSFQRIYACRLHFKKFALIDNSICANSFYTHTRARNERWFIRLMINCGYSTNIRSMEFRWEVRRRRRVLFCSSFHSNKLSTIIIKNRYHWMISMHVVLLQT